MIIHISSFQVINHDSKYDIYIYKIYTNNVHPPIHALIHPSIHPYIHLSIYPSIPSIHPSIHPSNRQYLHSRLSRHELQTSICELCNQVLHPKRVIFAVDRLQYQLGVLPQQIVYVREREQTLLDKFLDCIWWYDNDSDDKDESDDYDDKHEWKRKMTIPLMMMMMMMI